MNLLQNHIVLLTGAGSGLGLGVARHCIKAGAQIAIMEIAPEKVASLWEEFGDQAVIVQGDVTKLDDLQRCREAVLATYGRLDALIGLQGIFDQNVPIREIESGKLASLFDELFHINVLGHVLAIKVFLDLLEEANGAIVLTSSTAAYAADGGGLMYTGTKGAIRAMIPQLAFELGPKIRVNGVAPGAIANSKLRGPAALGMEMQDQSQIPSDAFLAAVKRLTLLKHLPTPEEYGPLYAFLASHENRIMTGQSVVCDQGGLNRAIISVKEEP